MTRQRQEGRRKGGGGEEAKLSEEEEEYCKTTKTYKRLIYVYMLSSYGLQKTTQLLA